MQNSSPVDAPTPQSSIAEDKIWQTPDLDPNTISILCTLKNNVKSFEDFHVELQKIQSNLGCSITMHGGHNSHALIWLRIKNVSDEVRQRAKDHIDSLTYLPCDQIFLPNHDENENQRKETMQEPSLLSKKFKPKQPTSREIPDDAADAFKRAEAAKSRNLTVTFAPSQGSSSSKNSKLKQISPPSSISSSSSSSSIGSSVFLVSSSSSSSSTSSSSSAALSSDSNFYANDLNNNSKESTSKVAPWSQATSSPFGSILSPYNPASISSRLKSAIQHDEEMYKANRGQAIIEDSLKEADGDLLQVKSNQSNTISTSRRYPVDVLLMRSDMASSKKMPDDWFDLNKKYPEVCFCGKVLAYFNPNKYHDHWEKTKLRNPDLHVVSSDSYLLQDQLGNLELNTNQYWSKGRMGTTDRSERHGFDRRFYKTDDFINSKTSANSSRKYASSNRQQFKFAAAVNSLNEANESNRRARTNYQHQETSYDYVGSSSLAHQSNHNGFSSRGVKFNGQ